MSGLEALGTALGISAAPAVLRRLRGFYADVDRRLAAASEGLQLPCRRGCSACCHEAVFLSALEFLAVAEVVLGWPSERRAEVLRQMEALAATFADELEMLEELPAGPERDEVAERIAFRCPLLDEAEACTVHGVRELNGRSFGQSFDQLRGHPFGCELTHQRLRVLGQPELPDPRALRKELAAFPGAGPVRVYPWWFSRYAEHFR